MKLILFLIVASLPLVAVAQSPVEDMEIRQQGEETLKWFRDAKLGMFLHWGLYAVTARGEWYMENAAVPPAEYRKLAFDQGDGNYFDAAEYNPRQWAHLAKMAGMKYIVLTARHHDGFALFDSRHPNAFTSLQTIKRDLFREYGDAVRESGLKLGVYYSPMSWRYPGYYDVSARALPNKWNYGTDAAHKEDARLMKEEVYEQVRTLFKEYGPFDYVFWDGSWLGQRGSDRDAAFFWEPGKHRDPSNAWPVPSEFSDFDEAGRALGLMGLVRKYSPNVLVNPRSGWIGDVQVREGNRKDAGPISADRPWERCLNLNVGSWGYHERQSLMPYEQIVDTFTTVLVRDGNMLLNFGPDRHGQIPEAHAEAARKFGRWLAQVADAVYGTRAGPWQPVDDRYGFTSRPGKIFVHLLAGYQGDEFTTPAVSQDVVTCRDLYRDRPLTFEQRADRSVVIRGIDRSAHPANTVVSLQLRDE